MPVRGTQTCSQAPTKGYVPVPVPGPYTERLYRWTDSQRTVFSLGYCKNSNSVLLKASMKINHFMVWSVCAGNVRYFAKVSRDCEIILTGNVSATELTSEPIEACARQALQFS